MITLKNQLNHQLNIILKNCACFEECYFFSLQIYHMAILLPEVFYTKNLNTAPTPTETKQDIALLYCIFSCQDFRWFCQPR